LTGIFATVATRIERCDAVFFVENRIFVLAEPTFSFHFTKFTHPGERLLLWTCAFQCDVEPLFLWTTKSV